tara:strand:+ start:7830 stop:9995 length:2166 start_codon:yes stop_codon:yes gene_type:complete
VNWYKEAKIGSVGLKMVGVPPTNIDAFIEYLHTFHDGLQKKLLKQIRKTPLMSVDELKAIPVDAKETKVPEEFEVLIGKMTQSAQEREWLRKLVVSGRFQKEDAIKLKGLLELFNKYCSGESIDQFKDDSALSIHVIQFKQKSHETSLEERKNLSGAELVGRDGNVECYFVTDQEALDKLGAGATWCVLTENGGTDYDPFEYYMFLIDGEPKGLLHWDSLQFKNEHDDEIGASPLTVNEISTIGESANLEFPSCDDVNFEAQTFNGAIESYVMDLHDDSYDFTDLNSYYTTMLKSRYIEDEYLNSSDKEQFVSDLIDNSFAAKDAHAKPELTIQHLALGSIDANMLSAVSKRIKHVADVNSVFDSSLSYEWGEAIATYAKLNDLTDTYSAIFDYYGAQLSGEWNSNPHPRSVGSLKKFVPSVLLTKEMVEKNITGWAMSIKKDWGHEDMPKEYEDHEIIKKVYLEMYEDHLTDLSNIPHSVMRDERMKPFLRRYFIDIVHTSPIDKGGNFMRPVVIYPFGKKTIFNNIRDCIDSVALFSEDEVDEIINSEGLSNASLYAWRQIIREAPFKYSLIPEEYLKDSEIIGLLDDPVRWGDAIGEQPTAYNYVPDFIKEMGQFKSRVIHHLTESPQRYNEYPDFAKQDLTVIQLVTKGWVDQIQYMFAKGFTSEHEMEINRNCPPEILNSPEVQAVIQQGQQGAFSASSLNLNKRAFNDNYIGKIF